ncbi:MAG: hypothetical protein AABO58_02000 [Acidobacteriota bacterium]
MVVVLFAASVRVASVPFAFQVIDEVALFGSVVGVGRREQLTAAVVDVGRGLGHPIHAFGGKI